MVVGAGFAGMCSVVVASSEDIREPLVYEGSEYRHPAEMLLKKIDSLQNLADDPHFLALNAEQRFAAKHYFSALQYCESGVWGVKSDLKKPSKTCKKVMSVYTELYARGYTWGYRTADLSSVDPVFLNMPTIARKCEENRRKFAATLQPSAKVQPFCNRKGGVINTNGGLASVLPIELEAPAGVTEQSQQAVASVSTQTTTTASDSKSSVKPKSAANKEHPNATTRNSSQVPPVAVASLLTDTEQLPVLYMTELRKVGVGGSYRKQSVARGVLDKYGFPMNAALTPDQIDQKRQELAALIRNLTERGKQLSRSAPRDGSGYIRLPAAQQNQLSEQVLYPALMDIQTRTIDLLSRIPRTEAGLDAAYEINDWLFSVENGYDSAWSNLITIHRTADGRKPHPDEVCSKASTAQQVAAGPKTGRCFFQEPYSASFLRIVWRVQYMREIDPVITAKITAQGADLYKKAFLFAYDLKSDSFDHHAQTNFANFSTSPAATNKRCLYDDCSSALTRAFLAEYSGKPLSDERKNAYLATLDAKSKSFIKRWEASAGQSKAQRYDIQTDIVAYSREAAQGILLKLSNSAAKELQTIPINDPEAYQVWQLRTAKPIRLQVVVWRELWDIGFGLGETEAAQSALGLSGFTDGYMRARHSGGSPFVGIAEILYDAQYQWLNKAGEGTVADVTASFPTTWSASGSYSKPKPYTRHYAYLLTPAELFFESIGRSVHQGAAALASYGSQIAQLEGRIESTRSQFFSCLPGCDDLEAKRIQYSKALLEKDIYFLEISGQSGSLVHAGKRNMTTVLEGLSGTSGVSLVDGGIPKVCQGYFAQWIVKVGQMNGMTQADIEATFGALSNMLAGKLNALEESGFNSVQKQRAAYAKSAVEYGKYQVCRDQYEFDRYAK
jgi:hypothetical protein